MRTGVQNPALFHRGSVDRFGVILACFLHKVGDCRLPLIVGPAVAAHLFDMWNIVTDRRIAKNQWALGAPNVECNEFSEAASRNVDRASVRLGLEKARSQAGSDAAIRDVGRNVIAEASDDEFRRPFPMRHYCPTPPSLHWIQRGTRLETPSPRNAERRMQPRTPRGTRMPKTGDPAESGREDLSFSQRHTPELPEAQIVVTAARGQLHKASQNPTRGWPPYETLCPIGGPALVIRDPIPISGIRRDLDGERGWVAGYPMESLAKALAAAGAATVDAGDSRALGANSGLPRALVGRGSQVWSPPGRKVRDGKKRQEWRLGVRFGPNASLRRPSAFSAWIPPPRGSARRAFGKFPKSFDARDRWAFRST